MPFIWALTPKTRFNFRCLVSRVLAHIFGEHTRPTRWPFLPTGTNLHPDLDADIKHMKWSNLKDPPRIELVVMLEGTDL